MGLGDTGFGGSFFGQLDAFPLPWLGLVTCAGLAVQSVVDDPELVLWAGGLLLFGLILWLIERTVR